MAILHRGSRRVPPLAGGALLAVIAGALTLTGRAHRPQAPTPSPTLAKEVLAGLPMIFEVNEGQADSRYRYLARGSGYTLAIDDQRAVFTFSQRKHGQKSRAAKARQAKKAGSSSSSLALKLVDANRKARVSGVDKLPGKVNYYLGNDPSKWRTNVSTYAKVKVDDVYPGIDLVYYGNQKNLEYDFVVAPGADPDRIRLTMEGADRMELSPTGELVIHDGDDTLRQAPPVIFQETDGKRQPVEGGYVRDTDGTIGFRVAEYDRSRPLVIDPVFLYSTMVGGMGADTAYAFTGLDQDLLIAGTTSGGFPVTSTPYSDTSHDGATDGFVIRLNTLQTGAAQLVAATYIGGENEDGIRSLIRKNGMTFISGTTDSPDFPGALNIHNGNDDGYIARLIDSGTSLGLAGACYIGGTQDDTGEALTMSSGIWLAGTTYSSTFPIAGGPSSGLQGASDPYLVGLDTDLSGYLSCRVFNGAGVDTAHGMAVDQDGAFYLTGASEGNLPNGMYHHTGKDAYVLKATRSASTFNIDYVRYIGGGGDDEGRAVAVDRHGQAYVTGSTTSYNFPLHYPHQTAHAGGKDAFLTKLRADGYFIDYSTFVGGPGDDVGECVTAGNLTPENAIIGGSTSQCGLPAGADGSGGNPNGAGFVCHIDTLVETYPSNSIASTAYFGGPGTAVYAVYGERYWERNYAAGGTSTGVTTANPFQGSTGTQDGFYSWFTMQFSPTYTYSRPMLTVMPELNVDHAIRVTLSNPTSAGIEKIWWRYLGSPYQYDNQVPYDLVYAGNHQGDERYVLYNAINGVKYWFVGQGTEAAMSTNEDFCVLRFDPPVLSAQTASNSQINLSWTSDEIAHTGFVIERRLPSGSWTTIANPGKNTRTYYDTGLIGAQTYYYRISIYNDLGSESGNTSAQIQAETSAVPTAPTGLTATATSWNTVQLNWTDTSTLETEYKIEWSPDTSFSSSTTVPQNTTSKSITGLQGNQQYRFRVKAIRDYFGDHYESAYSNTALATTPPPPPNPPSNFVGTGASLTSIALTWNDNSSNETGFKIERSTSSTFPTSLTTLVTTTGSNVTTFTDTGLTTALLYYYRIWSFNNNGDSTTVVITATTQDFPPANPANLNIYTLSTPDGYTKLRLIWSDMSNNETGFKIERSRDNFVAETIQVATVTSLQIPYDDSGLTSNTRYYYRVRATNSGGDSGYSNVAYSSTLANPPAAPHGLSVTVPAAPDGITKLQLSWTDGSSNETAFKIDRSTSSSFDTGLTTLTAAANATSYLDTGLTGLTTYYYRIRATNADGDSANTATASAQTRVPVPASPTGLQVAPPAAPDGATRLNVTWQDNSPHEADFAIERYQSGPTWVEIGSVAANVTSYQDTGLTPNTSYLYRVRARNSSGSALSTTQISSYTLPNAPGSVTASSNSQTTTTVNWTWSGTNPGSFVVERSPDNFGTPGAIVPVGTPAGSARSQGDSGLTAGTLYYYRVRATNSAGQSANSNVASVTTVPNPPAAPSGLTVSTPMITDGIRRLVLNWTDNSNNETSFLVERATDVNFLNNYTSLGSLGADTTTYTDTSTPNYNTVYYYRVSAANAGGSSSPSNTASATSQPPAPGAPNGLAATSGGPTAVNLTWSDNASNETGFEIERAPQGGSYALVGTAAANAEQYSDTGLAVNTTYQYRVRAYNLGGYSAYTSAVTTTTPPAAPTNLIATVSTSTRIQLDWTDNSTNETGFRIERSTNNFATVTTFTVNANVTSYLNVSLAANTTYSYRVCATNAHGSSAFTNVEVSRTSDPDAPSGLVATAASSTSIHVTWTDNSNNEDEFRLQKSENGTTWVLAEILPRNTTSFTVGSLTPNKKYWFRVRAINALGNVVSNTDDATTPQ